MLTNALKLLNRYETGSRKTIGQATDYLDDFMLTNSAFNLTLGSAWNAYPVTFKDITYSKTKLGGEAGLPWNEPGACALKSMIPRSLRSRRLSVPTVTEVWAATVRFMTMSSTT